MTSGQADISWWRISFGDPEVARLRDAVAGEHVGMGPVTAELEASLARALGVPFAVATTSGSSALYTALLALDLGQGDEVVMPDRTWVATAHAAILCGAKPVFVDVERERPVMSIEDLQRRLTPRTRAILPVHLNGRATDMTAINAIAAERGLLVIEDACQALFSRNEQGYLGTQSNAGCFSLGMTKLISSGQGGLVVTRDAKTHDKVRLARNHGVKDLFADTWLQMGFNFKYTDLQAAFAVVQLERAAARLEHLRALYRAYQDGLPEFDFLRLVPIDVAHGELPLYVEVVCPCRAALIEHLRHEHIQTRAVPPSLHTSSYLDARGDFPNSLRFSEQGLYLPSGPEQPLQNVERVLDALRRFQP